MSAYSSKFPEGTVAGVIKAAAAENGWQDLARFHSQRFNWTVQEFDRYSSAFAYGLVEMGLEEGDRLALWCDSTNSAEIATAQVGALKAGVTVVTIDHEDSVEDAAQALRDSGATALLFSPMTLDENKEKRANSLHSLIPELESIYPGDEFSCSAFPSLKHLIHTGHKTIPGTVKFKETMFYAKKANTNFRIPGCTADSTAFECYQNGNRIASYTNSEIVEHAESVHRQHFASTTKPVYVALNLQYPLAFASFIGAAANQKKVFVPGSYLLDEITK
jgi:acyl-CoA synthetase (AMP-forming)/AMP-acid ligase II